MAAAVWLAVVAAGPLAVIAAGPLALAALVVPAPAWAEDRPAPWSQAWPRDWTAVWPNTFAAAAPPAATVTPAQVVSLGTGRDPLPVIDQPQFMPADAVELDDEEPVALLKLEGQVRLYPLRVMLWHGLVNDQLGEVPVLLSYCALCSAVQAYDRRVGDTPLTFGITGLLRHANMLIYDRATESWWQQYTGEAVLGAHAGARLNALPVRIISFAMAIDKLGPETPTLLPPGHVRRAYGTTPYVGYDGAAAPPGLRGPMPTDPVAPMTYVVAVDDQAWTLALVARHQRIEAPGNLVLEWADTAASVLDTNEIAEGRRLPMVRVTRAGQDVAHVMTFAFAFRAFHPDGVIHH